MKKTCQLNGQFFRRIISLSTKKWNVNNLNIRKAIYIKINYETCIYFIIKPSRDGWLIRISDNSWKQKMRAKNTCQQRKSQQINNHVLQIRFAHQISQNQQKGNFKKSIRTLINYFCSDWRVDDCGTKSAHISQSKVTIHSLSDINR